MNAARDFFEQVYVINGETVSRKIAGETLLVPVRGKLADMQQIFSLNPAADYIWQHLDGHASLQQILDKLVAEFDVETETAVADMQEFIEELLKASLIIRAEHITQ